MRLIDADALKEHIADVPTWTQMREGEWRPKKYPAGMYDPEDVMSSIEIAPTIDAQPVRHGTWILHADGSGTCMECKSRQKIVWDYDNWQRYCGCCGAKMDRGVSDEG